MPYCILQQLDSSFLGELSPKLLHPLWMVIRCKATVCVCFYYSFVIPMIPAKSKPLLRILRNRIDLRRTGLFLMRAGPDGYFLPRKVLTFRVATLLHFPV